MNKVALVTGSSRGIGKAIITDFAKKGYNVVINYIKEYNEAERLKEKLENEYSIRALTIKADVSNEDEVQEMVANIKKEFKRIDMLVNNAGIAIDKEFEELYKRISVKKKLILLPFFIYIELHCVW